MTRASSTAAAGGEEVRTNATLLACEGAAPGLRYLGENASLFLRYLNATVRVPRGAVVTTETLALATAGARLRRLWRERSLIVHDKVAYREGATGDASLEAQLAGGVARATDIWARADADAAGALDYLAAVAPELRKKPPTAASLKGLLVDFRDRYPYYNGRCEHCGAASTDFVGEVSPTAAEAEAARAGRVELRACERCGAATRFVRANAVAYALGRSKRGRCGEYSAAFLAVLRALGVEARWIFDTTDHVWCEARLDGAWVHVDPCEASIGEPGLYEGWGKNGTLVVAFSEKDAADVTHAYYPSQTAAVRARRKDEGLGRAAIAAHLAAYKKG